MEKDEKGFYRPAWLLIAEGGWWKPSEVSEALDVPKEVATSRLGSMVRDGYLVRRTITPEMRKPCVIGTTERTEFAVMPECFVPGGLTAGMVAKALAA